MFTLTFVIIKLHEKYMQIVLIITMGLCQSSKFSVDINTFKKELHITSITAIVISHNFIQAGFS